MENVIKNTTLRDCIEFAVSTEERASGFYKGLANKFADNQELVQLFNRLSGDEQNHKRQFSQILSNLSTATNVECSTDKCDYLRAMSMPDFFKDQDGPFQNIDQIQSRDDALLMALDFEKATLGFYQAMDDIFGEKAALEQIMIAEKLHVSNLMTALLVEGSKFRSLDDKWS